MTSEELFEKYKDRPFDGARGGRGISSWQREIFDRIQQRNRDVGDEEATALLEHTLEFGEEKAISAGFP